MVRTPTKMLLLALLAAFTLASSVEAAPKKVRHRTKHSTRVSSGATATTGTDATPKKKAATAPTKAKTDAQAHRPAAKASGAKTPTAKKSAAKKSTRAKKSSAKRPTTKPR